MQIDFCDDTVQALSQLIKVSVTCSGHYILPLTKATQLLPIIGEDVGKNSNHLTLHLSQIMKNHSLLTVADKLHHQFAHAPADQLICLVKSAGSPWANDQDLKDQLKSTVCSCQTCKLYKSLQQSLSLAYHWQHIFKKQL